MQIYVKPPATDTPTLKKLVREVEHKTLHASKKDMDFARRVAVDGNLILKSDFFDARGLSRLWVEKPAGYEEFMDFILNHAKFEYPLQRPHALAKDLGIPYKRPAGYIRARGNSYPSAHAAAIWYTAYALGESLSPSDRKDLYALAQKASESRLVAGVHTRQDIEEGRRLARKAAPRKNPSTDVTPDGLYLTDAHGEYLWFHGSTLGSSSVEPSAPEANYDAMFFTNSQSLAETFVGDSEADDGSMLGSLLAVKIKNVKLLDPDNMFTDPILFEPHVDFTSLKLSPEGEALVAALQGTLNATEMTEFLKGLAGFSWVVFDPETSYHDGLIDCIRTLGYRGWVEKERPRMRGSAVITIALLYPYEDTDLRWVHHRSDE